MKVSEIWLREWVNPDLGVQELAARLTMAGLEIDSISPVAGVFDNVIVAKVVNTSPHPQADKLTLCDVSTGSDQIIKIVCGASNVRPGLIVALAQMGAKLPNGLVIKEAKLRGELSQGMLCSASELGLTDSSEGILELDENAPLGLDFREYLQLNDLVMDIDLTPNRADCLSVRGIAREVAALTQSSLKPLIADPVSPTIDEKKSIHLNAEEGCPFYCGRIIKGIDSRAITPIWMRERLRRCGIRSIHPVVDVANYVMLELGQPMHAFDLSRVQGDIQVRMSQKNEPLQLLDGQTVHLQGKEMVIADAQQSLALAGVMGGAFSAVNESTTDIFVESAWFQPVTIAGVARSYGLSSDSSQRFERGVDPSLPSVALEYATRLILDIAGGEAGPVSQAVCADYVQKPVTVLFKPEKVKQLTGLDVSETEMMDMLTGLGMLVTRQEGVWQVSVPPYRVDIHLDADLVEEITRLYGYDKIPGEEMTAAVRAGAINPVELLVMRLLPFFTARAYHETISYSFVDPQLQKVLYPDAAVMTLLNPISSELSQMRAGMWSGLIASMIYNTHRQQTAIKLVEQGVTFELNNGVINEKPCLGGLMMGECGALSWNEPGRAFDFYDMKGDLQALFDSLNLRHVRFETAQHPALHPGKTAAIWLENERIGWCGVLHPRISDALDVQHEVMLFELNLECLTKSVVPVFHPVSKFPRIRRDLSLLVDETVSIAQIEASVRQLVDKNWLKSFDVFDVFKGDSIPVGKKSIAFALTLQDQERTLVDLEINQIISAIIKKLEDEFAITLRD